MAPHILIVDDSPILMNLLKAHLVAEGFVVTAADDDRSVAAFLEKNRPDLIMLDLTMPDALSWERLAHLCEGSGVPILYISGPEIAGRRDRVSDLPQAQVLAKPFTFETLLRRITTMLMLDWSMFAA